TGERSPDAALGDNPDVVAFLRAERPPFRIGLRGSTAIAVPHLYRYGWAVYDEENRLLPPAVQDLGFLARTNPRGIDLLNVRYHLGGVRGPAVTRYASLDVSADVGEKTLPLDAPGSVASVSLVSRMLDARDVTQATPVATITLESDGRPPTVLT